MESSGGILASDVSIRPQSQVIAATLLTGVYDVNRNEQLAADQVAPIQAWYDSVLRLNLRGIIFHNSFSSPTIQSLTNPQISFVKVNYDGRLNPNAYRYLVYDAFLRVYGARITHLFVTDISDVVVIKNPFLQSLFLEHPGKLFCGDEPEILDNEWMRGHHAHFRNTIPGFADYEAANKNQPLLNCGIIGGELSVMKKLIDRLAYLHRTYSLHNTTAYTMDMGAFNFVARTEWANRLVHGAPVNTRFKGYESHRDDCWFRHK